MAPLKTICYGVSLLLLLRGAIVCNAQSNSDSVVAVNVVLTANAADLKDRNRLFQIIGNYCQSKRQPVVWILNGDIFPSEISAEEISRWLETALVLLNSYPNLHLLIAQGDRDWDDSGKEGLKKIQALEKTLGTTRHERLHMYLEHGCPGPWTFSVSPALEIVLLNSQWWNHPHEKPMPGSGDCDIADTDIFIEELEGILDEATDKNVMIVSHFPLESLGNYGGRFPTSTYLIPPVVGSALAGFHQNVGNSKDLANNNFAPFRYKLESVLQNYSSLIYASGHEHNQSVMMSEQNYFINSGALETGKYVARDKHALLTSSESGFIEVSYLSNGRVDYQLFTVVGNEAKPNSGGTLLYSMCEGSSSKPVNTTYNPCKSDENKKSTSTVDVTKPTHAVGGPEYASSGFKEMWLGEHYRASWTASVQVPYLNMDTTYGGLKVNGKGGGRQTTSLKLSGNDGREYVYRSVNKDPSKALPLELRGTVISDVLKDQTTTQHPYGALAVAYWLNELNILHATPTLYVLPDAEALGSFRNEYANLFGMLEVRPTDKIENAKIFGGAQDIEKSFKMFDKLYRTHDNRVAKDEFVKARVFDMWIGDWSKHEDNWKWAGYKDESNKDDKGELFRPIPRDRDHAFSKWDGVIPWLGDREWAMPNGENFDVKIRGMRSLVWQARHLDRFLTSDVTKQQWLDAANEIQSSISDADITEGIKKMPPEIYEPEGREIEQKLKVRIKDLPQYASRYYDILSKEVDVVGSNKKEYFDVKRNADGTVTVTVMDVDKEQKPVLSAVYFQRTFLQHETKEIRLFGLEGDDVFMINGAASESILVRVIGGEGHDVITDHSSVKKGSPKTKIYEEEKESRIDLGTEARKIIPKEEEYYHYDRKAFKYNTYFPIALVTFNPFTGFAIQGGATFTRQHFGKPDFSTKHRIKGTISTQGNYEVSYANQLRYLVGRWDGISEVTLSRPLNYNFFFGIGNDTKQDTEKSKNYYRTQYNLINVSAGLTRTFWTQSNVAFIASYEHDEGILRDDSYLADNPDVLGVEPLDLFFLRGIVDLDFRDRQSLPERGFRLTFNQVGGHVSDVKGEIVSISEMELENYFSTYTRNPITFGLQLGGGVTHGELPFYKLFSLGQTNNLSGFKRNRFTGQSKAYMNTELRWQLTETRNTFIPLKVGIRGFFDIGRVWADTDTAAADYWHYGYGGGFYVTPFREQFAFNISAGSSREESLIVMISIGSFLR